MTVLLILVLLAIVFGAGAVLKGIAWLFIATVVLLAVAAFFGYRRLRDAVKNR